MNREQAVLLLWEGANAYAYDRAKAANALRILGMTPVEELLAKALQNIEKGEEGYSLALEELTDRGMSDAEARASLEKWGFHE